VARSSEPLENFIDDFLASFAKRRKAIKYQLRELSVERVVERDLDGESRKLEILLIPLMPRTRIEVSAWEDRWISVSASRSSKEGWRWLYSHQGRLLGGLGGRGLVVAIEESISAAHSANAGSTSHFERIWTPILAAGPRPLP
jgi:hypothetical protein